MCDSHILKFAWGFKWSHKPGFCADGMRARGLLKKIKWNVIDSTLAQTMLHFIYTVQKPNFWSQGIFFGSDLGIKTSNAFIIYIETEKESLWNMPALKHCFESLIPGVKPKRLLLSILQIRHVVWIPLDCWGGEIRKRKKAA